MTTNALQSKNNAAAHGATNAFITELNPAGTGLLYSSYLGGSALPIYDGEYLGDYNYSMALDSTGDAYLVGAAASLNFPVTSNAFQKSNNAAPAGSANVFVTKVNLAGATTTKVPTTTTLTASRYDSTYPQPVTFTATVKAASEPTPEGNVTFKSGETWIGEAAVVEGAASLTTTALPVGTLSITAIYEGDSAHAGSTSLVLKEVVK